MYSVNDKFLISSRPRNILENDYKEDIEKIMTNSGYHSNEMSETDIEKAQEETNEKIRPKNKTETDNFHVIRVYDKLWRSKRVGKTYINLYTL
jgi:hypothetical protein